MAISKNSSLCEKSQILTFRAVNLKNKLLNFFIYIYRERFLKVGIFFFFIGKDALFQDFHFNIRFYLFQISLILNCVALQQLLFWCLTDFLAGLQLVKPQLLSGQWIMLFKRWIPMNPCAVHEMQFLKCFGSVQVASIFILDELRWNMIFSSSFPDRKIEYHWPSWTVSVSQNCHLLLKMLRGKIIEQLSQLLPLLLFTVCATVILKGTSWAQGSILLDIVKIYDRRSFPREIRISVEKIRLGRGSRRNWRLEQANGRIRNRRI